MRAGCGSPAKAGSVRRLLLALLLLVGLAFPAVAQTFPKLTGRVVDAADLLPPAEEAAISAKLQALETASTRQLVVATIPDLQGRDIADYGYRLGRAWGIGQGEADNGAILIVAPAARQVRIEVGRGLEPILTDAVSSLIIQNRITPAFRRGDYPGGISAGVDAIVEQLRAPPEVAERAAIEAAAARRQQGEAGASRGNGGGSILPLIFWGAIFLFVVLPMLRRAGGGGKRYRGSGPWGARGGRRRGGMDPVSSILLWELANAAARGGRGGGGFGGFGGGGGGFGGVGGFSGGGGDFGGGGASGSW